MNGQIGGASKSMRVFESTKCRHWTHETRDSRAGWTLSPNDYLLAIFSLSRRARKKRTRRINNKSATPDDLFNCLNRAESLARRAHIPLAMIQFFCSLTPCQTYLKRIGRVEELGRWLWRPPMPRLPPAEPAGGRWPQGEDWHYMNIYLAVNALDV